MCFKPKLFVRLIFPFTKYLQCKTRYYNKTWKRKESFILMYIFVFVVYIRIKINIFEPTFHACKTFKFPSCKSNSKHYLSTQRYRNKISLLKEIFIVYYFCFEFQMKTKYVSFWFWHERISCDEQPIYSRKYANNTKKKDASGNQEFLYIIIRNAKQTYSLQYAQGLTNTNTLVCSPTVNRSIVR